MNYNIIITSGQKTWICLTILQLNYILHQGMSKINALNSNKSKKKNRIFLALLQQINKMMVVQVVWMNMGLKRSIIIGRSY